MSEYRIKRLCAGEYIVTVKGDPHKREVHISCCEYWDGPGWTASAQWVTDVYSDPYETKRQAVQSAKSMLETWDERGRYIPDLKG